jgi:cytochrome c oxidase subunit 2
MEVWGQQLYNQRGCAGCHSVDGSTRVGPSFQNVYGSTHPLADGSSVTVDEQYIRESILEPKAKVVAGYQPVMPSYKGQLTDDDIQSLIAYMRSISNLGTSEAGETEDAEQASEESAEAAAEGAAPANE